MKSERRHELEHNQLADWLAQSTEQLRPHARIIAWTAIGLVVVLVAVLGWSRWSASVTRATWREFYAALDNTEKLPEFAEKHSDNEAGQMAALILADRLASSAGYELFNNKTLAQDDNRKAMEWYSKVLSNPRKQIIEQRATFGLAQAKEIAGDLAEATKLYEQVRQRWPNSVFAIQAQDRLRDLGKQSTKAMYDRLATYDPRPALTPSGSRPLFNPGDPLVPPSEPSPSGSLPGTTFDMKLDGPLVTPPKESPAAQPEAPKPQEGDTTAPSDKTPPGDKPAREAEKPSSVPADSGSAPLGNTPTESAPKENVGAAPAASSAGDSDKPNNATE